MRIREINFWLLIAKCLPKRLVYICGCLILGHATTGKYSSTVLPSIAAGEALKRYADDAGIQ